MRGELLVAIMKDLYDWETARERHWYRIPVLNAQRMLKDCWPPQWLAFYQTKPFGAECCAIHYYARVTDIQERYRWQLFPGQPHNEANQKRYYQVMLGPLEKLPLNTRQINEEMKGYTLPMIVDNINRLGGVEEEGKFMPRRIDPDDPDGARQLTLFDSL